MRKIGISIVIPVYNSEGWIGEALRHIIRAIGRSNFDAEIIVVDDGSSDKSVEEARSVKTPKGIKRIIVEQENAGRYLARKRGVATTSKENILFIDSRVFIEENSLKYLESQLQDNNDQIWNGHVHVAKKGNIFARFWDAIARIGWRRYFKKPSRTSYGLKDFDYYPKGTGFFFVPKKRLLDAMDYFERTSNDLEFSSDDTLLIRYLAEHQQINLSPDFSCIYHGRSTMKGFLKHAYNRGQFFVDGFLRKGTRFFYPLITVLVLSVLALVSLVIAFNPVVFVILAGMLLFIAGLFFGAIFLRVGVKDAGALAVLGVPFAAVYLLGIWRGVFRRVTITGMKGFFTKRRGFLRGTIGEYVIVSIVYFIALAIITKGVVLNMTTQIFASGPGDATAGFMWLNYADPGMSPFLEHTNQVNYPVGEAIGGPTFVAYMALWLPIRFFSALFGPIAGLNIVMITGFMTAAISAYWLVKRMTGNVIAAFFAGYSVAFVPYAVQKSLIHLSYIFSGIFVGMLASFIALWRKPTLRRGVLFGLMVALACYIDGYFILLAAIMTIGMVIGGGIFSFISRCSVGELLERVKVLVITLFSFMILVLPIGIVQISQGSGVSEELSGSRMNPIEAEIRAYRSNVIDFLLPPKTGYVHKNTDDIEIMHDYKDLRSNPGESMNYISRVIVLLIGFGLAILFVIVLARKYFSPIISTDKERLFLLVGCITIITVPLFIMFMFSPEVIVAGRVIPLPGKLFIDLDLNLWRVMSRFFVPLNVLLSVFAAFSLYILYRYITPRTKVSLSRKITGGLVVVTLTVLMMLDYAMDLPTRPYDFTRQVPAAYKWIGEQDNINLVAELPLVDPHDGRTAKYVTYQIVHGKKLVNMRDPNRNRMNGALGGDVNNETLDFLYQRGVDTVILRGKTCGMKTWGQLIYRSQAEQDEQNWGMQVCVYKLITKSETDGLFAVITGGARSVIDQGDIQKFILDKDKVSLSVVDALFRPINNEKKAILRVTLEMDKETTWEIAQEGKVLLRGSGGGVIDVNVDPTTPVELNITSPISGAIFISLPDVDISAS